MHLRPARESDLPALIELAKRSWRSGFAESAPAAFVQEWLARDFERDWYPKHWPSMTVAETDGVVLGVVQPMADEINGLWVDPAAQGRGVGSALLAHAEEQIMAAGFDRSWLSCSGFNLKGQRFYLSRGYTLFRSETKRRGSGVVEEMLYYERRLPRSAAT